MTCLKRQKLFFAPPYNSFYYSIRSEFFVRLSRYLQVLGVLSILNSPGQANTCERTNPVIREKQNIFLIVGIGNFVIKYKNKNVLLLF